MYNVYVKRIFVITEIMHMNEKTGTDVSSEKEKVKESQSRSVTLSLDIPIGCRVGASHRNSTILVLTRSSCSGDQLCLLCRRNLTDRSPENLERR